MTLPAQEAKELALTASPVSREAAEHVLDYLLWNKAMIGENMAVTERLEKYLDMVRNLKEGVHVVIQDPYERATALLFELVLSEEFNPWAIDLVRFTQLYLDRIKVTGMDFPIAGRLIYMAWNILFLQSQVVLSSRKDPEPLPQDPGAVPLEDGYLGEMSSPEELDVTNTILTSPEPPFSAMVRHAETRPVSLMELARAFTEAETEARLALEAEEARQKMRKEQALVRDVLVHGEEVPLSDLTAVWNIALKHPIGERFTFEEALEGISSRERVVSLFLSMLFLVQRGGITLHQDMIGRGAIFLVRTQDTMDSTGMLVKSDVPPPVATPNN